MGIEIERYGPDPDIVYKRSDPRTLKTVLYPCPKGLIAPRVDIDRVITAARDVSRQLVKKKFDELAGIGTSGIDTGICVNYYGTQFTVDVRMSDQQARDAYREALRKQESRARRHRLGIKLVR